MSTTEPSDTPRRRRRYPPVRFDRQLVVMVDKKMGDSVDALAEERQISISGVLRDLVQRGLDTLHDRTPTRGEHERSDKATMDTSPGSDRE